MKILSLRIKNLASLAGEQFIDFEAEPLASSGLIAIVGKTGAGKSTILDAMCLALFNKIPRLKKGDGKIEDTDGTLLASESPVTVLRRGTAHGFAELCFVAQDQKKYLARWEVKRARNKADGKLQPAQRSLTCLNDGIVIANKPTPVEKAVQDITQLSFEQFTRAVLLAQSEVTAFLNARDSERGELLEYLTDSSIFAQVGILAYEKTKVITTQRKELENIMGHIELLSQDDFSLLNNDLLKAQQQQQQLEQEKERLQAQQTWLSHKQKLIHDIALKQSQFVQLQEQKRTAEPEFHQLQRLEIFAEIRPNILQQQKIHQQQQALAPKITQTKQDFEHFTQQFERQKEKYSQAELTLNTLHEFEATHQKSLDEVKNCVQKRELIKQEFIEVEKNLTTSQAEQIPLQEKKEQLTQQKIQLEQQIQTIQQQLMQTENFSRLDATLAAYLPQLKQFIIDYKKIETQFGSLTQAKQGLEQDKKNLAGLIAQMGDATTIKNKLADLNAISEQKIQHIHKISLIQQQLKQWFELKQLLEQQLEQLQKLQNEQSTCQNTYTEASQALSEAKQARQQLQIILQQQQRLHDANIEKLREQLKQDEACIVCGSLEHPYRTNAQAISKSLFELQQQQEQEALEKEQQALDAEKNAQQALTKVTIQHQQIASLFEQNKEKFVVLQQTLSSQASDIALQLDFEQKNLELNLNTLKQEYEQHVHDFKQQQQQLLTAQEEQQLLTTKIQNNEHLIHTAQQLKQQLQPITDCFNEAQNHVWQQQSSNAAAQTLQLLTQRYKYLQQLNEISLHLKQRQEQLNEQERKIEYVVQKIVDNEQRSQDVKIKGQENTTHAQVLIESMTGIKHEKPHEWLITHQEKMQRAQQLYKQEQREFEQQRAKFEYLKNQLLTLQHQHKNQQDELESLSSLRKDWLITQPSFTEEDLIQLVLIESQQEQQLRQKLQLLENQLSQAKAALNTLQEQLTAHQQLQNIDIDAIQLEQQIAENQLALTEKTEQRNALKVKLELHLKNQQKQQQFALQIEKVTQEEQRWSKISGLIGDASGKKFRDYAQQYHLDILIEYANQQLSLLSQRYTLKRLDNSLSLAIIDHDMGDEVRAVASLSGGESFLTALALSLAIATLASGSMKIESLFIDEGFGTLDAASLHLAMDALDHLHSQGRKVILISHVQEMHERIPTQIQVQACGAGASQISIVG